MTITTTLTQLQKQLASHEGLLKALEAKRDKTSERYPVTREWLGKQITDAQRKIATIKRAISKLETAEIEAVVL